MLQSGSDEKAVVERPLPSKMNDDTILKQNKKSWCKLIFHSKSQSRKGKPSNKGLPPDYLLGIWRTIDIEILNPGIMYFRAQLQRMQNCTKSTAGTASTFSMELT